MDPNEVLQGTETTWGEVNKEDLIPEGTYHVRIKKAEFRLPKPEKIAEKAASGEKAYPNVYIDAVIQEEGEYFGRHVFENLTLMPGSMFRLRQLAEESGLDMEEHADAPIRETVKLLENREVLAVVVKQEGQKGYQDKNSMKQFISLTKSGLLGQV